MYPGSKRNSLLRLLQAGVASLCCILVLSGCASREEPSILVATASNFAGTLQELADQFQQESGITVQLSPGATGKHFAQVQHGAPYHVFFAADAARPTRLEESGHATPGSRFTYALGKLVLWSPDQNRINQTSQVLLDGHFDRLALANPRLAPYGRAAKEALDNLGLWESLHDRLIMGENAGQALQFVKSGQVELGFVAAAQVLQEKGSSWNVPGHLYEPIVQQAVLLKDTPEARAFLEYVQQPEALAVIRRSGYGTPQ